MPPFQKLNYMHLSIDDVIEILQELELNDFQSVWEHPIFAMLQRFNSQYGAVFSLYCFYETKDGQWKLDQLSNRFKDEFRGASHWLRFGFHGKGYESQYGYSEDSIGPDVASEHYSLVNNAICTFASSAVIDTIPRIHFYKGTLETIRNWKASMYGIKGLLTADDTRDEVYYLNQIQRAGLVKYDVYYDLEEQLYFIHTDLRLEHEENPIDVLEARATNPQHHEQQRSLCIFTHEDQLQEASMILKIEDCCKWASNNGYRFSFPMDQVPIR